MSPRPLWQIPPGHNSEEWNDIGNKHTSVTVKLRLFGLDCNALHPSQFVSDLQNTIICTKVSSIADFPQKKLIKYKHLQSANLHDVHLVYIQVQQYI